MTSFSSASDLTTYSAISGIATGESLFLHGYYTNGDGGGGRFVLRAAVAGEVIDNGVTFTLFDGRVAQRIFDGPVSVRWYGAKGDGSTDDIAAIQTAIDYAIYLGRINAVYVPAGQYKVSRTIQLGYGVNYPSPYTNVDFFGPTYEQVTGTSPSNARQGASIICDFSDGPGINIQGGRGTKVRNLSIFGKNLNWVQSNGLWNGSATLDMRNPDNWADPTLAANAYTQNTPYAGITIDAYCSPTAPTPAYANVVFPSFLGSPGQYNKPYFSTMSTFYGLTIAGFVAGIVANPYGSSGQTDFMAFDRCWIDNCVYGISVCGVNAREYSLTNSYINQVHTAIVTGVNGDQIGQWGAAIVNTGFDRLVQWLDIPDSGAPRGGSVTFLNCYGETVYRLGNFGGGGAASQPLTFENCTVNFNNNGNTNVGIPDYYLKIGSQAILFLKGGLMNLYQRAFVIRAQFLNVNIDGTSFSHNFAFSLTHLYEKVVHTASCGGLFIVPSQSPGGLMRPNTFHGRVAPAYKLDGSSSGTGLTIPEKCLSTRNQPLCIHSNWFSGTANTNAYYNFATGNVVAKSALASVTLVGTLLTFDYTGRSSHQFELYGPAPGDVLMDLNTGSIFYVASVTGITVTAELQNNYYLDSSSNCHYVNPFSTSSGTLAFITCRRYSTSTFLSANMSSSSATLTNAQRADGSTSGSSGELVVGDRLVNDLFTQNYINDSNNKINSINTAAKTVTMAGTFNKSFTDPVPLPMWIVPPLPNNL